MELRNALCIILLFVAFSPFAVWRIWLDIWILVLYLSLMSIITR